MYEPSFHQDLNGDGVIGIPGTSAITFDTAAPGTPTIASFSADTGVVADGVTNVSVLAPSGTAEAGGTVDNFDFAALLGTVPVTSSLTNGLHHFSAAARDLADNTSTASQATDVTVNSVPPIAVSMTSLTLSGKGIALLSGTSEANSTVALYDSNSSTLLGTAKTAANGTCSVPMAGVSNTVHSCTANASDQTGNTGSTNAVFGTTANDTITAMVPNETFFGKGGTDTFVFSANFGNDTIADISASNDIVQLTHNQVVDIASALVASTQVGSDVVVAVDSHDSITLHNTALAQLTGNDFHIV